MIFFVENKYLLGLNQSKMSANCISTKFSCTYFIRREFEADSIHVLRQCYMDNVSELNFDFPYSLNVIHTVYPQQSYSFLRL
jgi:hypothetical protein